MPKEALRDYEAIIENVLLPMQGVNIADNRRSKAIMYVLARIPKSDYEKLNDSFCWFVPHEHVDGWCTSYPISYSDSDSEMPGMVEHSIKVIYLSPRLEKASWDIVVGTVAHELAHIILGHKLLTTNSKIYGAQEKEAWGLVGEWGFEAEAQKVQRLTNWKKRRGLL